MNDYLQSLRIKLHNIARSLQKKLNNINGVLQRQINKNIYTRILFTNVAVYIAALATLAVFSGVMVKQVISDQVKQDLLRKAKRVNFALTQEQDFTVESGDPTHAEQNLLRFMAESFDARITVFVPKGMILKTSAEHDVLPGSKVDAKYVELLAGGEANVFYEIDGETGQLSCIAVIPMGNPEDTRKAANKGIILQTQPVNLDLALNKMFLSLFIGGTVILIFIVVISVYLAMRISGPISRLAAGVAEISRENLILNDDGRPPDEINILVGQINKLAERLKKMQTDSARMEEERARLFAEISHELRTPLTAVLGFTEAIRDEIVEDETLRRKYIEMIYNQTLHVTRLVDDIMSLSRLESGNINVSRLPLDLVALAGGSGHVNGRHGENKK
jgi:HAMP domain-containing protein